MAKPRTTPTRRTTPRKAVNVTDPIAHAARAAAVQAVEQGHMEAAMARALVPVTMGDDGVYDLTVGWDPPAQPRKMRLPPKGEIYEVAGKVPSAVSDAAVDLGLLNQQIASRTDPDGNIRLHESEILQSRHLVTTIIDGLFLPGSREKFRKALADPANPIDDEDLAVLILQIMAVCGNRPTDPVSSS